MKALLDTQALIWAISGSNRLPLRVHELLEDENSLVYFSAINTWEIVIKQQLGKLSLPFGKLTEAIENALFVELPFHHRHVIRLKSLSMHHRDPFDRALAAQALADDLLLLSNDKAFEAYEVKVFWD